MGLGAMRSDDPNFISMPGMHGSYAANMAMSNADLLIALGVRFDDRVTGRLAAFAPHAKVIHVDIDPAEVGKIRTPEVPIVGDVKRVLVKLTKLLAGNSRRTRRQAQRRPPRLVAADPRLEGRAPLRHAHQRYRNQAPAPDGRNRPPLRRRRHHHQRRRPAPDVGRAALRFNEPRLWINSGGLGSMGFGLPAAIGAQLARPDKLVFSICGDGGFQMSIPELATIASHGLPIKIIVMNNGHLGMVRQWQTLFYNNRLSSVELDAFPDAEKLAAAYGFKGRTIDKPWELASALEEAVKEPGPYLLNVKVTPFECVYPMVPAGGAINEMVLGPPQPVAVPSRQDRRA